MIETVVLFLFSQWLKSRTQAPTFTYLSNAIRVVQIDGQPWFVAIDVLTPLGFGYENLKYHRKRTLHVDEKRVVGLPGSRGIGLSVISESGLYKLIMRSDKPEARKFQDWVTREVLPAIRKDGLYVAGEERLKTGEMSDDELTLTAVASL